MEDTRRRQRWLWGEGGYYWMDIDEWGLPSLPSEEGAWQAFIGFAPVKVIQDLYTSLEKQCAEAEAATAPLSAAKAEFCRKVPSSQQLQLDALRRRIPSGLREGGKRGKQTLLQPLGWGAGLN